MSAYCVHCPECNKKLVLKDRSLLGRKGKCPKCGHRFVLSLPQSDEPVNQVVQLPPVRDEAEAVQDELTSPPSTRPVNEGAIEIPRIETGSTITGENYSQRYTRRRQGARRFWMTGGLIFAIFVISIGGFIWTQRQDIPPLEDIASQPPPVQSVQEPKSVASPAQEMEGPVADREPIQLLMVPSGARLIVNLRPAELWSDDPRLMELRQCLTEDVLASLTDMLKTVAHREPQQIEEVLLAWILGARGTEPQLAAVVHLAEEERLSDLIDEFGGEPLDELAQPKVYLHGEQAVLIRDRSTLAFAPRELAEELADWIEVPNYNTSDGILALLKETDRNQLLTVVCEPTDVGRHVELLFPPKVHAISQLVTSWFAEQAETVAWSVNVSHEFRSEFLLRGASTITASTLEEQITERIETLPSQLTDTIERLQPSRSGIRTLIGRFPTMLEVSRQATQSSNDGRIVRLVTVLPPKAGPNLALASVLTWAESQRQSLPDEVSSPSAITVSEQRTIAERLRLLVDAEFNRTPLQEAINYVASEINVTIDIDGDALKDAGYTKNMPQTFDLGMIPARDVLWKILKQYQEVGKQMVLIVNEAEGRATVKTRKFADAAGETPYELAPAASPE
ncbi:MAG: hypothetical protein R3C02_16195 [Planctomycetaceae bacterium]